MRHPLELPVVRRLYPIKKKERNSIEEETRMEKGSGR